MVLSGLGIEAIEVAQERIAVVVDDDPSSHHVLIDLFLATLPAVLPEPSLIRGHGQGWPKLKHTVLTFGDLHLGT